MTNENQNNGQTGQQGLSNLWDEEAKQLGVGSNFLKLEEATAYTITFLDEGVKKVEPMKDPKTGQMKEVTKRSFRVKVVGGKGIVLNGEEKTWDVPYGGTSKSLYGKLIELFQKNRTAVNYTIHIAKDIDKDGKPQYKVLEWNALDNERVFKK